MSGKKIIPILGVPGLVGIMSGALLALLGVQWYWATNAISLKEEQFDRQVNDVLNQVVERLQDSETAHLITMDIHAGEFPHDLWVARPEADSQPDRHKLRIITEERIKYPGRREENVEVKVLQLGNSDSGKVSMAYNYSFSNGKELVFSTQDQNDIAVMETDSLHDETVVLAQRDGEEYVQMVVRRLLMDNHPIESRISPGQIDSLLREGFAQQGITDDCTFEIVQQPVAVTPVGMVPERQYLAPEGSYAVRLFPRDLKPSLNHLLVQFPHRQTATVRAMGLLLPTSGVLVLVVVLCFGLTLYALQRQKKLSEMKTDFINNMTHELKTPISTISLALQALNDPDMRSEDTIERYTGIIGEENDRLRAHVERVLQAAAIEQGSLQLNWAELDLQSVVADAVARTRLHAEERQGKIEYTAEARNAMVRGDAVHLAGIVDNLLDNALKYSPQAPAIEVRLQNVPNGLELTVADQGQGMSREVQKRIFEKFYREPQGNVHDVKGFGLGLSYVQAMVQAHGGQISVESEPGKGSVFTVFIPQRES